ncbi:MAG: L-threonine 3-dehydrogenase [Firmicutes bacterium]|nr:L-threonine 3-dehydrogenase [Bacillota bacterium]
MKALVKMRAAPGLEIAEVSVPDVGPGEVLVRLEACSICGTDTHIYSWDDWSRSRIVPPRVIGHEGAGFVVAAGPGVMGVKAGDYVSFDSHQTCGMCYMCRTGQAHVCRDYRILGVDVDGCFAEYARVPAGSVWVNPREMPPEHASVQDPFGNAVMATLAGEVAGQSVLVTGCGAIGVFSVAIAKRCGASVVVGVDVNPYRLELARRMGADHVFNSRTQPWEDAVRDLTGGLGADVVLEMSGNPDALRAGLSLARNGGRVALLGIPPGAVALDLTRDVVFKGLRVDGITGRRLFDTWYKTSALIGHVVDVAPVITHRFSIDDYDIAFRLMIKGECGKVILYPGRSAGSLAAR